MSGKKNDSDIDLATFIKACKYATVDRAADGRRIARGALKKGLKIGADTHKTFEMHEANTGDMFDAEAEVSPGNMLAYNGALMALQLRSVGDFKGPFTQDMIRKLHPADFNVLRQAQVELDVLGEAE